MCIFRNKLLVNIPGEYLKNSMYNYKNIYTSIINPSQNILKKYDNKSNCIEHDFIIYLSDEIKNEGLNKFVNISLTIPFDPNYLKYVYINKEHILSQLNKPSINIYYRRCLEMLLKYV